MGFVAGRCQAHAILASPEVFLTTKTWKEVRAALGSSSYGKISILLLWLNGFAILGLISLGASTASVSTAISAYTLFGIGREVGSFRSIRKLTELT